MTAWAPSELQQALVRYEAVGYRRADRLHAPETGGCCLAAAERKVGVECFGSEETPSVPWAQMPLFQLQLRQTPLHPMQGVIWACALE